MASAIRANLLGGLLLIAALLGGHAVAGETARVRVMTLNIFYGGDELNLKAGQFCKKAEGCQAQLQRIIEVIRASQADIVGLEEGEHNTRVIANALGFYYSERTQTVSRFPLRDPPGANGNYVLAEIVKGRYVAVANMHLPSDPYGPYAVRDGAALEELLNLERSTRLPALQARLPALSELSRRGIPVFVTGDFNSPSHWDWTAAVAATRADVPYPVEWPASVALAAAGFRDAYREVYPDPVARPGFTWTPGGPESAPAEIFDRIDWVLASGPAQAIRAELVGELGNPDVDLAFPKYPTDHRGVVATFVLTPGDVGQFVAVDDRRHSVGDDVAVYAQAPRGSSVELVDLKRHAAVARVGLTAATAHIPTIALEPAPYAVRLVDGRGAELSRSRLWLYAPDTGPTVATLKPTYRAGEPITVKFRAAPGMRWDWVAVYKATGGSSSPFAGTCNATSCGSGDFLIGQYTGAEIEGRVTLNGTWVYDNTDAWPLAPGRYEVRLLLDDGYRQLAYSAPFRVVE